MTVVSEFFAVEVFRVRCFPAGQAELPDGDQLPRLPAEEELEQCQVGGPGLSRLWGSGFRSRLRGV